MAKETRIYSLLLLGASLVLVLFTLTIADRQEVTWSLAQPIPIGKEDLDTSADSHSIDTTLGQQFKYLPMPSEFANQPIRGDIRRYPLLYFRIWSNSPPPAVPAFLFLLFSSTIFWYLFPNTLTTAVEYHRTHFWKSLAYGICTISIVLISARALNASNIGGPLARLLLGLLEAGLLAGFAISAKMAGQALAQALKLHVIEAQSDSKHNHTARMIIDLALGTVLLIIFLAIPGFGMIPRIGIRLVLLYCILGFGALVSLYKRKG